MDDNKVNEMNRKFFLLLTITLFCVACSSLSMDNRQAVVPEKSIEEESYDLSEKPSTTLAPVDSTTTESREKTTADGYITDATGGVSASEPMPPMADVDRMLLSDDEFLGEMDESMPDTGGYVEEMQQVSILKAGEIDDNDNWDDYLTYRKESLDNFAQLVHDVDVSGRQIITVNDAQGLPVLGALVRVYVDQTQVSQTRTYANGQTQFFPNADSASKDETEFRVEIEKDGINETFDMNIRRGGPSWEFTLDVEQNRETLQLDLVFLLDATGSMSDEIAQLQDNILSISEQIDAMGDVDVRYGLVHYRDRGDAYVSRVHDFTTDVKQFQKDLNAVRADGGGDTPESLNEGLHDALHNVEWRGGDTIKLVFLVADAAPHLDYPDDFDYAEDMLYAMEQGIKVHPIASSGLELVGEYIFRQIGQTTMGRFIFLTYDGATGSAPGDERTDLEAGEEDYTVDFLNGLVVRLIEEELNHVKGVQEIIEKP